MRTFLCGLSFVLLWAPVCGADTHQTVDLQWSVCDASVEDVLAKISIQVIKDDQNFGKSKRITYFDTGAGAYLRDGVSFRTKIGKSKGESSVKVRFDQAHEVSGADCSWDRYGNEQKWTCEVVNILQADSRLWSKDQLDFLSAEYRSVDTATLMTFGPYKNPKWKFKVDQWDVAFDSVQTREVGPLMEFSIKVPVGQGDTAYLQFSNWLHAKGVVLCDRQEPKTQRLLRALGRI